MSTNDDIRDAFIRHQIFVQRYAKGREREAEEFIRQVLDEAVSRLNIDLTELSRARLDRLIQDLIQLVNELNGTYTDGFIQEALDFVEYEVGFNFRVLGANVAVDTILPNMAQVQAAMLTNIMDLEPTKGYTIRDALQEFGRKKGQQIVQKIRDGIVLGETTQQIVKNIKDLEGIQSRQAAALARTVTNHVSIQARQITMRENDDIIDSYQWVATLDSRTSLICASRDGQVFKDIDSNPKPPAHFNCVLGGTLITSALGISSASKRVFKGEVVTIKTVSGNELTVTPNHPILTAKGWKPAKLLNVGDKCVSQTQPERVGSIDGDNDGAFKTAEQIFEAFSASCHVLSREVIVTAPDFHGDGANNEVANIATARNLLGVLNAGIVKKFSKCRFYLRCFDVPSLRKSRVSLGDFFVANGTSASGFIRGCYELLSFGMAGAIHSGLLLFGSSAKRDPAISENALNGTWADAEGFSDPCNADPFSVFLDDIASVQTSELCDHVYNLETLDHCYSANGIITHNCRSTITWVVNPEFDLGADIEGDRPSVGADGTRSVAADTTYEQWLRKQPKTFQEEVLGIAKAKLFRDGKISIGRFVDEQGRVLSLDELRELEPLAFQRAGL